MIKFWFIKISRYPHHSLCTKENPHPHCNREEAQPSIEPQGVRELVVNVKHTFSILFYDEKLTLIRIYINSQSLLLALSTKVWEVQCLAVLSRLPRDVFSASKVSFTPHTDSKNTSLEQRIGCRVRQKYEMRKVVREAFIECFSFHFLHIMNIDIRSRAPTCIMHVDL